MTACPPFHIKAKYDGECPKCRAPIYAGHDCIAKGEDGMWICAACKREEVGE
jgi:hypothetical protein